MSANWKIILGAAFFALIPVGVKIAPESGILTLLTGRLLVAVLILFILHREKSELWMVLRKQAGKLFFWSLFMLGAMWSYFVSISICGAGLSSCLLGTQPVFMVILSYFFLKESISPFTWIVATISLSGVLLISNPGNGIGDLIGVLAGIVSSLLLCFNFIVQKKWFTQLVATDAVFFQSLMQLIILLPLTLYLEEMHVSAIPSSLLLGIFCTVLAYSLIYSGAKETKGQLIGVLQSVEYALPVPIGILFFGEKFSLMQWAGVGLILGACLLIPLRTVSKSKGGESL